VCGVVCGVCVVCVCVCGVVCVCVVCVWCVCFLSVCCVVCVCVRARPVIRTSYWQLSIIQSFVCVLFKYEVRDCLEL
jgi:hypothetical protein